MEKKELACYYISKDTSKATYQMNLRSYVYSNSRTFISFFFKKNYGPSQSKPEPTQLDCNMGPTLIKPEPNKKAMGWT